MGAVGDADVEQVGRLALPVEAQRHVDFAARRQDRERVVDVAVWPARRSIKTHVVNK